jgi:3-oxoacyl-[acyl-carrier-protein] synthase II
VTPLGLGVESFFSALLRGENGIRTIERFDTEDFAVRIAGEIRGIHYHADDHFSTKEQRRMDPFTQFGVVAAREAWKDAGFQGQEPPDPTRSGVILGTGIGGIQTIMDQHESLLNNGPRRVSPFFIPNTMANALPANVAIEFGLQGGCFLTASACSSAGHAIGLAMREIRDGRADLMVTGGSEATTTPLCLAGFASLKALSTWNDRPDKASRPFDIERNGFVMGEGAGVFVIEEMEAAKARGARIYCELAGFFQTDDAGHITAPDSTAERPAAAMAGALKDAGCSADQIGYINAHGTSTQLNDKVESLAIRIALGDAADQAWVSSTKSMTGHLIGAAAGIEAIACILSIANGVVHPTRNCQQPDVEAGCTLDYVPGDARERTLQAAMSNSLGFGGHNVSLVFKAFS